MNALFKVFGEGKTGRKAEDLERHSVILADAGMVVPQGFVIRTGVFDQLKTKLRLQKEISTEKLEERGCPDFLGSINVSILDQMEVGKPYAIRSSALSEQGGTGIYQSSFFWLTGNRTEDEKALWQAEAQVYASEFTPSAKYWREKNNAQMGMAILIQPVVGFEFEGGVLPPMAGTAYTSYHGLPTVRLAVGMGTLAVNGGGLVYNYPPKEFHGLRGLQRAVWEEEMEFITPKGIQRTSSNYMEIHRELDNGFASFQRLFEVLAKLRKNGELYLEWAVYRDTIFALQCAEYQDRLPGDLVFDSTGYFMFVQGQDVLHSGRASCKSVVYVGDWSPETSEALERLNGEMTDYLLVVPQQASSTLSRIGEHQRSRFPGTGGKRLAFSHFSNAKAVVEQQVHYESANAAIVGLTDHTGKVGADHFAELCNRTDILFIGAQFDPTPLGRTPGAIDREDGNISVWNIEAEVVVNTSEKKGYVYLKKASV